MQHRTAGATLPICTDPLSVPLYLPLYLPRLSATSSPILLSNPSHPLHPPTHSTFSSPPPPRSPTSPPPLPSPSSPLLHHVSPHPPSPSLPLTIPSLARPSPHPSPPYQENGEWWRVVACNWLHAGLIHLAMNMIVSFTHHSSPRISCIAFNMTP